MFSGGIEKEILVWNVLSVYFFQSPKEEQVKKRAKLFFSTLVKPFKITVG